MSNLLMAMPGRDYPIGYLVAAIFFIAAVALFIISFFIKEDTNADKTGDTANVSDESDLYSKDYDTPVLEYSENFADEIIRMIEEEEKALKAQETSDNPENAEQGAAGRDTIPVAAEGNTVPDIVKSDKQDTIVVETADKISTDV